MMCHVAMAPVGGRIAWHHPVLADRADYVPYRLDVVDVATGDLRTVVEEARVRRPCWFPDGRRIAFGGDREDGPDEATWIVDVESGQRRQLCVGEVRCVSTDGRTLLVGRLGSLQRIDSATGEVIDEDIELAGPLAVIGMRVPHEGRDVHADISGHGILYDALPTTGSPQVLVAGYMGPTAKHTVKLCDRNGARFVTIVPSTWGGGLSYGRFDLDSGRHGR